MSGKQPANGSVVPLMEWATEGIRRVYAFIRDKAPGAELRDTYTLLLNTVLAMKEFAQGIPDSEARNSFCVNAFWLHIKTVQEANKGEKMR